MTVHYSYQNFICSDIFVVFLQLPYLESDFLSVAYNTGANLVWRVISDRC